MRKLTMSSIAIILFACLFFTGCGGDDDDDDNNAIVPDGGGILDGGIFGGLNDVTITVGPGARPTISVSQPIQTLLVLGSTPIWGFSSPNVDRPDSLTFAGPFQYGVIPDGAEVLVPDAPDLIAGQSYTVQVSVLNNAETLLTGTYIFTR